MEKVVNQRLIDQLQAKKEEVMALADSQEVKVFNFDEINIDVIDSKRKKIMLGDHVLLGEATKAIADRLKVKPHFFNLGTRMGDEDFKDVQTKLKSIEKNTPVYALMHGNNVDKIYFTKPEQNIIDYDIYFDYLIEELKIANIKMDLQNFNFYGGQVYIDLINPKNDIVVLKDDPWKTGSQISFGKTNFDIRPYFLRRICTNGASTKENGFHAHLSHKKFNGEKIRQQIAEVLGSGHESLNDYVISKVNQLVGVNVSADELLQTRRFFQNKLMSFGKDVSIANEFVDTHFPVDYLLGAYKTELSEKSTQWLKTADSGINAYDHFNTITYLSSHLKESKLPVDVAKEGQLYSSNILFKKELDMAQIAPKVSIKAPKTSLAINAPKAEAKNEVKVKETANSKSVGRAASTSPKAKGEAKVKVTRTKKEAVK